MQADFYGNRERFHRQLARQLLLLTDPVKKLLAGLIRVAHNRRRLAALDAVAKAGVTRLI
jgi:hypothetical protein